MGFHSRGHTAFQLPRERTRNPTANVSGKDCLGLAVTSGPPHSLPGSPTTPCGSPRQPGGGPVGEGLAACPPRPERAAEAAAVNGYSCSHRASRSRLSRAPLLADEAAGKGGEKRSPAGARASGGAGGWGV